MRISIWYSTIHNSILLVMIPIPWFLNKKTLETESMLLEQIELIKKKVSKNKQDTTS